MEGGVGEERIRGVQFWGENKSGEGRRVFDGLCLGEKRMVILSVSSLDYRTISKEQVS